jgi:hypothetical protein
MSYKSGDLKVTTPPIGEECSDGLCWSCPGETYHTLPGVIDTNDKSGRREEAFLPHSCDEWIIGGPKEVAALIHDLFVVYNGMLNDQG